MRDGELSAAWEKPGTTGPPRSDRREREGRKGQPTAPTEVSGVSKNSVTETISSTQVVDIDVKPGNGDQIDPIKLKQSEEISGRDLHDRRLRRGDRRRGQSPVR